MLIRYLLAVGTVLGLAACSGTPTLTTSSLFSTSNQSSGATTTPKPATPVDRALHLGATTARARKCGYHFDPARLRQAFIDAETTRGTPAELVTKASQSYDFTDKKISAKIATDQTYCSATRTAQIKKALQRALAGDFEPPRNKKPKDNSGLLAGYEAPSGGREVFNPGHIYDPLLNEKPTRRVETE